MGNALDWTPPFLFDYVYTMILGDIPGNLRKPFLGNLFNNCVKPGGRLILGPWGDGGQMEQELSNLGYALSGYCEKTIPGRSREIKRVAWIDKAKGHQHGPAFG